MADLYFRVWETAAEVALGDPVNENKVSIGGTTAASSVIDSTGGNRSRRVRIFADGNCYVTWGANPTATNDGTSGMPVGSENPEYVWIQADHKIAVIQRT